MLLAPPESHSNEPHVIQTQFILLKGSDAYTCCSPSANMHEPQIPWLSSYYRQPYYLKSEIPRAKCTTQPTTQHLQPAARLKILCLSQNAQQTDTLAICLTPTVSHKSLSQNAKTQIHPLCLPLIKVSSPSQFLASSADEHNKSNIISQTARAKCAT